MKFSFLPIFVSAALVAGVFSLIYWQKTNELKNQITNLSRQEEKLKETLTTVENDLKLLKSQDQYLFNKDLESQIKSIQTTYQKAVSSYEAILDLKAVSKNTQKLDELFAESLDLLSQKNYASAEANLGQIETQIKAEKEKIAAAFVISQSVPASNSPPSSGYSRQKVDTGVGSFLVDIVSADLSSTKVIVDTAADSDCADNCPVLPLADYVSRNGAFAGVNGSYFCPATYPSCAGKTNSFDTLLMNKNKVYFNSGNNVYSTVPVAVFGDGWARFLGRSLDWGRDTGVDAVIANYPLLLSEGNIAFGGNDDPKQGSRGSRSFIGNKGSLLYIGVTHNATVAEVAHVLKSLGLENALNLDDGGSTALWSGGYKVGPGRNLPNVVLLVRK